MEHCSQLKEKNLTYEDIDAILCNPSNKNLQWIKLIEKDLEYLSTPEFNICFSASRKKKILKNLNTYIKRKLDLYMENFLQGKSALSQQVHLLDILSNHVFKITIYEGSSCTQELFADVLTFLIDLQVMSCHNDHFEISSVFLKDKLDAVSPNVMMNCLKNSVILQLEECKKSQQLAFLFEHVISKNKDLLAKKEFFLKSLVVLKCILRKLKRDNKTIYDELRVRLLFLLKDLPLNFTRWLSQIGLAESNAVDDIPNSNSVKALIKKINIENAFKVFNEGSFLKSVPSLADKKNTRNKPSERPSNSLLSVTREQTSTSLSSPKRLGSQDFSTAAKRGKKSASEFDAEADPNDHHLPFIEIGVQIKPESLDQSNQTNSVQCSLNETQTNAISVASTASQASTSSHTVGTQTSSESLISYITLEIKTFLDSLSKFNRMNNWIESHKENGFINLNHLQEDSLSHVSDTDASGRQSIDVTVCASAIESLKENSMLQLSSLSNDLLLMNTSPFASCNDIDALNSKCTSNCASNGDGTQNCDCKSNGACISNYFYSRQNNGNSQIEIHL